MFAKSMVIGSCVIGALAAFGSIAGADDIKTNGSVCHAHNASQVLDIDHLSNGVKNINASPRTVTCAIPRSPLAAGANARFEVDGVNVSGTSTSCTLFVYTSAGTERTSQNIGGSGTWTGVAQFVAGVVQPGDNASLLCTLPGNGTGKIVSVTSVQ